MLLRIYDPNLHINSFLNQFFKQSVVLSARSLKIYTRFRFFIFFRNTNTNKQTFPTTLVNLGSLPLGEAGLRLGGARGLSFRRTGGRGTRLNGPLSFSIFAVYTIYSSFFSMQNHP